MATRSAALPIERRYLVRAWFLVSAIVIAATAIVAFALTSPGGGAAGEDLRTDPTGRIGEVADYGTSSGSRTPIEFNGITCGQCR